MAQYLVPNVVERVAGGERSVDIYSRLLSERIIFIGTEIDDGVANVVMAQLVHLASESADLDIHLYINSPGGSVTSVMAIYDTMQFVRPDVSTFCLGQAASTAALLLAAGAAGKRNVLEHSRVVLHQPSGEGRGSLEDLILQAEEISRVRSQLESVLSRHTGQSVDQLRADTDRDRILDAGSAVAYGLADRVIGQMPVGAG